MAKYSVKEPTIEWDAWQYTDKGRIDGIIGNVDVSDFESLISDAITSEINTIPRKTDEQIANEVIAGIWGNGQQRKEKLTAAGYDYNKIQDIVNKKIRKR